MKRILTLLISFFVLFNLTTNLFAFSIRNASDFDFDSFALEQIQKTFTSNLSINDFSSTNKSQNKSAQDNILFTATDFNFIYQSFSNNLEILSILPFCKLNDFMVTNKDVDSSIFLCNKTGLTKYKIDFNSYIATVIPDNYKDYINNIKCWQFFNCQHFLLEEIW